MNRLVLGHGLLGRSIVDKTGWDYISREKDCIDFCKPETYADYIVGCDEVINCIGHTNTYDEKRDQHWKVNYEGVAELVNICNKLDVKLIHIGTDYLYSYSKVGATENDVPVHCRNWYGYTKLLADGYIQLKSNKYLLLRSTHKEEPFPGDKAWINQIGNFDYVSTISELIITLIRKRVTGIYNVGTEIKTMYDLAKKTNPKVKSNFIHTEDTTPTNIVMDVSKMKNAFESGG
jgi:dTDP-4-dehydrorhamnose reductase